MFNPSETQCCNTLVPTSPRSVLFNIPGPPLLRHLLNFRTARKRVHRVMVEMAQEYGPLVRFSLGRRFIILVSEPSDIQYILKDAPERFLKSKNYERLKPLLGEGLLTSERDTWRRQRKMIQPIFHRRALERFANDMRGATQSMLEKWETRAIQETLDVHQEMMRLTLDIVGRTLFSQDVTRDADKIGGSLRISLKAANRRVVSFFVLPAAIPTPRNLREKKALAVLDQIVSEMIRERREGKRKEEDLLQLLLQAEEEESGQLMSDRQVRDECMTLFLAGHETTANALSWTFFLLARHPQVRERLQVEIDRVLNGNTPTLDKLPELHYLAAVIDEVLRLYPPAWIIERRNLQEECLQGYAIPPDTDLIVSPFVAQHNPRDWPDPETFNPERFVKGQEVPRHPFSYFPFGGGPRVCIGKAFALMEIQIVLAMIMQRFTIDLASDMTTIEEEPVVTLRPKNGIPVRLQPRT